MFEAQHAAGNAALPLQVVLDKALDAGVSLRSGQAVVYTLFAIRESDKVTRLLRSDLLEHLAAFAKDVKEVENDLPEDVRDRLSRGIVGALSVAGWM